MLRLLLVISLFSLAGCESTYYAAMEKVGVHKRDIMVDRVEQARDSQQQAQQEFQSALQSFQALTRFDGGELQDAFETAKSAYEQSQSAADDVSERIESVASVSEALFDEWQDELTQIQSDRLRRDSQTKLKATQQKYTVLMQSMRKAESKMQPVLAALKDNMLYLKHNLNAAAISSLEQEYKMIQSDINELVQEMQRAIASSDAFIQSLSGS